MEFSCGGFTHVEKMPFSSAIRTFVTHDIIIPVEEGDFVFRMKRVSGRAPAVWKLKLIDNNPFMPIAYGIKESYLCGGGEITCVDGIATAVGLGREAELVIDDAQVPKAGRYILRILYAAGDNRDISIQANGGEVIHTYLHSTSGWSFPTWENIGEKEVLTELKEGKNQIRMFNAHGLISHIKGIVLIADNG